MTHDQTLIENAKSELELAILYGNEMREIELRIRIAEMQKAEHVPVEPDEVYSPHTVVVDGDE